MKVEIRNNTVSIEGYVNAVERDSRAIPSVRGKFVEQVRSKTWDKALKRADNVPMLFNHNKDRKLGSTKEGSLELHEDSIGLRAKATITDTEVVEKAKKHQLTGWSFGFRTLKDSWEDTNDSSIKRRFLDDIELLEVSVLDKTPAYRGTSVEMRDNEEVLLEYREIEDNISNESEEDHKDSIKDKEKNKKIKKEETTFEESEDEEIDTEEDRKKINNKKSKGCKRSMPFFDVEKAKLELLKIKNI